MLANKSLELSNVQPPRRLSGPLGSALAAVMYLALGSLGLSLAIAPGYASPFFPAAGFSVAILLLTRGRAWPGIWIGSLLLNLGVAWLNGKAGWGSALLAGGIATGATVQAWIAQALIRRYVPGGWHTLQFEGEIVRCLALGGPVASIISATAGVSLLCLAGVIALPESLYAWWNWWSGDTVGVLVMLPLSLAVLLRGELPWQGRLTTMALPMSVAIALVATAYFAVAHWEHYLLKEKIHRQGENLAQLLDQRLIAHHESLSALRRLIEVSPGMTYAQFEYFTRMTLKDNPDIFALSMNPYVLAGERAGFEKTFALKTGTPGFEIRERDKQGQMVRAGERPAYVAVGYIAPQLGNRPAIGYDIFSEPVRGAAIAQARETGEPAVTAPLQLVQENRKRTGVLVLHPAYAREDNDYTTRRLNGFAVGVIKVDELVEIATRSADISGWFVQIDDADAPAGKTLLHRSDGASSRLDERYQWQTKLRMTNHTWTLKLIPSAEYLRREQHWLAVAVGLAGMTLAALLQVLLLVTTGRTATVQRKVQEQTSELATKSITLEERNAQLDALFQLSPDGLVGLSPDQRIKFVNPAFEAMTGISATAILNQPLITLESEIRRRMDNPQGFAGIASFFAHDDDKLPRREILVLTSPRLKELQVVGIQGQSSSLSQFLYLRDVTHEAEVSRLKSEFLSHAAHELRTPMTSILGFSEVLLAMDIDEETRRDLLETIHRQTLLVVDIINELLDLSRIENRQGKDIRIEQVNVAELVRDTVTALAFDPQRWPVVMNLPPDNATVMADPAKLRQALNNVLSNARKYSPDGGEIAIEIVLAKGRLGIVITDHGIGMTDAQLAHYGERFWRADTSGKTPGTGLGISIVKETLKLLGGYLDISSAPGVQTQVTLWLPVALPKHDGVI